MTQYAIYDVFTGTALSGNPLAVVFDADHLDEQTMAAVAGEFNLSETVFVLAAENRAHTARLRIFTPASELPFAGHPTVGASVALAERQVGENLPVGGLDLVQVLEEKVGPLRCAARLMKGEPAFSEFDLPRLSSQISIPLDEAEIGAALGLDPHELGFENHRMSFWSAGVPFLLVPVHDLAAAAKVECDAVQLQQSVPMGEGRLASVYVYCRGGVHHNASFHARMFAPHDGIAEDPATGAAVAALSGAIHQYDGLLDGHHALLIEQGVEMGRTSHIHLHLDCASGAIAKARIGGQAVLVARGELTL